MLYCECNNTPGISTAKQILINTRKPNWSMGNNQSDYKTTTSDAYADPSGKGFRLAAPLKSTFVFILLL